jgi:hypothetical protein
MSEYRELMISVAEPIKNAMQAQQLKSLVESGLYKPDPSQIAAAMLSRRGVRELLIAGQSIGGQGDRTHGSPAMPPRAA